MNDQRDSAAPSEDHLVTAELVDVVEPAVGPKTPWGLWFTLLFSAVVFGTFAVVQTVVVLPFVIVQMQRQPGISPEELVQVVESNGLCISLATSFSAVVCTGLILLFVKLRRPISVREYLALNGTTGRAFLFWSVAVVAFMLTSDGVTFLLGRDIVPPVIIKAYETAGFVPLLWFAMICMAPLFEEVFFRGFIFTGIRNSRLGGLGAIVITSLIWAAIHLQYDVYQISLIFLGGLLLGTARLKTESLYMTIAMHSVWNVIATVEVAIVVGG